jgi:hypothetical protein
MREEGSEEKGRRERGGAHQYLIIVNKRSETERRE